MNIYLVQAENDDCVNLDLFVKAATRAEAVQAWLDYYELERDDSALNHVWLINPDAPPGAMGWETDAVYRVIG